MSSRKVLATHDTADFGDCVNTGYHFTLYGDGRVAADYHSRWQGSRDGARFTTAVGAVDLAYLDDWEDATALLAWWVASNTPPQEDIACCGGGTWRQIRTGHLVR